MVRVLRQLLFHEAQNCTPSPLTGLFETLAPQFVPGDLPYLRRRQLPSGSKAARWMGFAHYAALKPPKTTHLVQGAMGGASSGSRGQPSYRWLEYISSHRPNEVGRRASRYSTSAHSAGLGFPFFPPSFRPFARSCFRWSVFSSFIPSAWF